MIDSAATECLLFPEVFAKPIRMEFDQRQGSSDGGAVLLKAAEQRFELICSMVDCLFDDRQATKVDHPLKDPFAQRVFSIACGYPDANVSARLAAMGSKIGESAAAGNRKRPTSWGSHIVAGIPRRGIPRCCDRRCGRGGRRNCGR